MNPPTPKPPPIRSDTVPPVPATCPPERLDELNAARLSARLDLRSAESSEERARQWRKVADASVHHYENLLLEVSGQGTLELP